MEGGQSQQIRTMTRDLARAQKETISQRPLGLDIAKKTAPPAPPSKPLAISDILAQARKRTEVKPPSPPQPPPQKPIEDILPIEEKQEKLTKLIEPPDNLPTEEGLLKVSKPPQAPPPSSPKPTALQPKPAGEARLMAPEEILGLSSRPSAKEQPAPPPARHLPEAKPMSKNIPPPPAPKPIRPLSALKFSLVAAGLGLILLLVIGGIVWRIFIQAPPPPISTRPIEQPPPQPLIIHPLNQVQGVEIDELKYDSLKPHLNALQTAEFPPDTLTYIPVRIRAGKEVRSLTLAELFDTLQLDAPPAFFDYPKYTLFLYTQKLISKTLCETAGIQDSFCYGPRLGVVMKLPEDPTAYNITSKAMKEWEKTLAENFQPLMIFVPQRETRQSFELGRHGEFDTHYLNLPIHTMSVDWILTGKYLIIATSKDAARTAFDNLETP